MAFGVLSGVHVLDLSSYLAGPYACTLLADLGADVIKVEPPQGDMMRRYPSSFSDDSRTFIGANRNKRSVCIDLKHPEGLSILLELLDRTDVLIHNFRPGVPERLGIGYEDLSQRYPRLVFAELTGFGSEGPLHSNPGFDQVMQCFTGIADLQGRGDETPKIVWGSIVDYFSATLLALGVCGALFQRAQTGRGQRVDCSLLRSALALQAGRLVWASGEPLEIERDLRLGRVTGIHPTKDGYIYIQAQTDSFWHALCEILGLTSLADDERFNDMRKRKAEEAVLMPLIRDALMKKSAEDWSRLFGDRVPCAVVQSLEEMFLHPQVMAQQIIKTFPHADLGTYQGVCEPIRFSDPDIRLEDKGAPTLGQHTKEVLSTLNYSTDEIERLVQRSVCR
ncbi:MAG: CoA transferase [Betaproteobacteria bacterium]|jgi:formyl-CoA transferase|nr:CoA transferase [Betaproteobacteria bacterium]